MVNLILDSNNYLVYQDTPWDAKVLGFKTNEIKEIVYSDEKQLYKSLTKFEEACQSQKYLFTNTRINPVDQILKKALTEHGYFNTETSLLVERGIYNLKFDKNIENLKFSIRECKIQDLDELRVISFDIFNHGRFFEDPYISAGNARIRNKNWIDDLLKMSKIIVGELNNRIFGFMAFNVEGEKALLLLGGVRSNFSIYSYPFWNKVFLELISNYKAKQITGIVSASNIRILNLYSYFGFKFLKAYFGYHKHRKLS
jgi:hypothetical protein